MFYFEARFPAMSESKLCLKLNPAGEYHYYYIQNDEADLNQLVDDGLLIRSETSVAVG